MKLELQKPNSMGQIQIPDQIRKMLNLAIPIALIEAVGHLMVLTDLIVIGRLGTLEFAAVGLATTFFWVLVVVGISVLSVIAVLVAETRAQSTQEKEIGQYGAHGFWVCLILTILIAPIIWFMSDLLSMTGLHTELMPIIKEYSRAITWALLPALLFAWLRNILIGLEISAPVTIVAVIAMPANLILSLLLVFGYGLIPGLGVKGAGYGTAVINMAMFLGLVGYIYFKLPRIFSVLSNHIFDVDRRIFTNILRIGGGQAVITVLENSMFAVVAILIGTISVEALVAHNMVFAVLELGVLLVLGFGEAVMIRIANSIGHREYSTAYFICFLGLVFSFVIASIIVCGLIFAPNLLQAIFLEKDSGVDAEIVGLVLETFVVAASISLFFDATQTILYHAVRATRDEIVPVVIAVIGYWLVGLGCGYYLGFSLGWGISGIWIGLAFGLFVKAMLMGLRFHYRIRYLQNEENIK